MGSKVLSIRPLGYIVSIVATVFVAKISTAQLVESIPADQLQTATSCSENQLFNSYYFIPKQDIQSVAAFYNSTFPLLFNGMASLYTFNGRRNRAVTYFDSQDLTLLENQKELLISLDIDFPAYRLEKEQILLIDSSVTPVKSTKYESKSYNKKASSLDKHPLLGKVKRKERQALIGSIGDGHSIQPEQIISVLTVDHEEVVVLLELFDSLQAAITLDNFSISNLGIPNAYYLLKMEFFQAGPPHLTSDERMMVDQAFCESRTEFEKSFPNIKRRAWFGYRDYHQLANLTSPGRSYFKRFPIVFTAGHIATLLLLGALVLFLPFRKYNKPTAYRIVSKYPRPHDNSNRP